MNKCEVITIVKDWIHDLSYINMETDVEHIMKSDEDTFKVYYYSSEFTISITWLEKSECTTIFINHQFIASIENNGEIVYDESYYEEKLKPLSQFDIRSLISRLKHPPTEEFKSFCKGVEEWLSHLNNSTFKWYWYSPTTNSIGKCFKVQVGPFERLFHIENRDGGIVLGINYTPSIKYIDGVITILTAKPIQPFTFEEISNLRDTIFTMMNHEDDKIKRIEEILKQWLSDMTMTYTKSENEHEFITCMARRGSHPSTHAVIGISVHEKNPCIWLYNTLNRIIMFNPDNNWEPDMCLPHRSEYPFTNTVINKLMALYVKEFCDGIDYEFRNTIFVTVEQWLKRKSHNDSNYHDLTLTSNNIKDIRWNIPVGCYNLDWIDNKWRLSRIMFCTYKRIIDITPNGGMINKGLMIGDECDDLINEIKEAIQPTPDSTDEDLLESISNTYRTINDIIENPLVISKSLSDKCINDNKSREPWVLLNPRKDINEIRKEFKEAVKLVEPVTTVIDSMTDITYKIIKQRGSETGMNIPNIKHVLFNETKKVTTVIFADGSRVTSKAIPEDEFDPEIGFAMCIMKKMYGNRIRFQKQIEKYMLAGEHRNRKIVEKANRKTNKNQEED